MVIAPAAYDDDDDDGAEALEEAAIRRNVTFFFRGGMLHGVDCKRKVGAANNLRFQAQECCIKSESCSSALMPLAMLFS